MAHNIDGGGNLNRFPDIHAASDGMLIKYGITTRFPLETKHHLIDCLIALVSDRATPAVKQYGIDGLSLIKRDIEKPPNYQGADKLWADDVLCEICDILADITDDEILDTAVSHIAEQMSDMIKTSGTCPSGRVNRLIQVYMILRDFKDGNHLPPSEQ